MIIEGYKQITEEESHKLHEFEYAMFTDENDNDSYFKKVQKFPIVFKDDEFLFEVNEHGGVSVYHNKAYMFFLSDSLPLLERALEKSKEIRK